MDLITLLIVVILILLIAGLVLHFFPVKEPFRTVVGVVVLIVVLLIVLQHFGRLG